jgi:hypothetical protein
MTPTQQRVLLQIRRELAEVGHEVSCAELESMRQFLILLDAAGSSDGLQHTLDRLAPTWHGENSYSLLQVPTASSDHQAAF